jgi:O-antigen/teichoic acid export membrane protein
MTVEAGEEPASSDLLDSAAAGPAAVRGGALRIAGYAAGSLLALGSGAVLYHYLGVIESGRYTAAGSLVALVASGSDLGLTAIGLRELAIRSGDDRLRMAGALLGLRLLIVFAGVIVVTVFALIAYGLTLGIGVALAGVGLVFTVWQSTLAIPLMVDMRLGWTSLLEFLRQLLLSILIVVLVEAGAGLLAFLASPIPASLAVLALTAILFRGQVPMRIRLVADQWRALLAPVISYAAAVAAAAIYFRVAILLVSVLSNGTQLGYFGLSFNIMAALFAIPAMLVSVAFPIFSRAARDDHVRLAYAIERVFEVSLIIGVWMSLAIALGAGFAIEVIGGHKFAPAAGVLAIQGISVGAVFVGAVWGFGLLSLERHRAILIFNLTALAAVIAVVAILAGIDGARGAAIGTSAIELANAIVGYWMLAHGRRHLRPSLRALPKVAVAIAIASAPALLDVSEPARVAISAVLYLLALLALRALPTELLDLLPDRLRRAG